MTEYEKMIQLMINERASRAAHHSIADQIYTRGALVDHRSANGWQSSIIIATDFGRRLFVENQRCGRVGWIGITSLRSRSHPDLDIHDEIVRAK